MGKRLKNLIGIVVSNKMPFTLVVKVEKRYPHPIYSKTLVKTKKYLVHSWSNPNRLSVGDKVLISESPKPSYSKRKHWILIS